MQNRGTIARILHGTFPHHPVPPTNQRREGSREEGSAGAAMEPTRRQVEGGRASSAMALRPKRQSQGKQRIQIRFIDNKDRRQVTLSKRRKGLFKKATELSQLCDARVAVIVFSQMGKAFAIGSPSVDDVLRAYAPHSDDWLLQDDVDDAAVACGAMVETSLRQTEEIKALVEGEQARRMNAIGEKVMHTMDRKRFWWEADVNQLDETELPEFALALQRLRDNVQRHLDEKGSAAHSATLPLLLLQ